MAALEDLLQQHAVWRGGAFARPAGAVPTGYPGFDRELPGGGWPLGALTEILGLCEGVGELQLVLPALAASGVDLAHLVVVRAPGRRDALWAAEQVLRAGNCHALLAWLRDARYPELRRLAVAAGTSRAFVALFRRREAIATSSPACLRIALEPAGEGLCARILKRPGAPAAAPLRIAVKKPVHALGRTPFPLSAARDARTHRRLGLPVHA